MFSWDKICWKMTGNAPSPSQKQLENDVMDVCLQIIQSKACFFFLSPYAYSSRGC